MPVSTLASRERPSYEDAHLQIDFDRQVVSVDSGTVELTAKEFALLAFLAEHAGEVLARESLLLAVWGYGEQIRTRTLDVHLARIRKKLGPFGRLYIETVFGLGCRFQPQGGRRTCAVPGPAIANVA
ncbi:MAG TPA: winged helix-turn-helix domain-containing protein [Bryobacteraceae bacterium]|nr:winged helix-turn-helix domain-containing protein [Bryobacteraceae bacterium]